MSAQSIAIKPMPGTSVSTFWTNTAEKSGEYNTFFVYISKILSEGKLVQVKPVATSNPESVNCAELIITKDLVAGIVRKAEGIFFRTHEGISKNIADSATIQLVTKDKTIDLGPIIAKINHSTEEYRPMLSLYAHYIKLAVEAAKRQQQARDAVIEAR